MPEERVLVRDIMSREIVSVDPEATVAEALAKMEHHRIHELPVMQNSTLKGWLNYDNLIRRPHGAPGAKVTSLMHAGPKISATAELTAAADMMIRQNVRALPVADGKGNMVGILSRTDVMGAAADLAEIAHQPLEKVMTRDLETIADDASVDEAAHRLRALSIRQLLVLDKKGKLEGTVGREVILHALSSEDKNAPSKGRLGRVSASGRSKDRAIDLKGLVEEPLVLGPADELGEAIRRMLKQHRSMVVVVEEGFPVGVVARANVLERLAARLLPDGPLVQVIGLTNHVDSSVLDQIHTYARRTLSKIEQEFRLEFLSLHYKVYKAKTDGDSKYSVTAHLSTEQKFFVAKADDWDAVRATNAVLDELQRQSRESKELRLERRKAPRRKASFYSAAP